MAEYLVTGGAGFIGSHLVSALAERSAKVRVLDDFSSGSRANLAGLRNGVELLEGDIRDPDAVKRAVRGVKVVFHHAALTSVPLSVSDPALTDAVNAAGTLRVLEAAHNAGVKRVVFASSSAVYGAPGDHPSREDEAGSFASPYALSKWVAEQHALLFYRLHGLETVSLRYFNVYGPRQDASSPYASVIPIFTRSLIRGKAPTIHGDGTQTRDFIFIDDVVAANLHASESSAVVGLAVNIATGHSRSVNELYKKLASSFPKAPAAIHGPPREGDLVHSRADVNLARRSGFRPTVDIDSGIERTTAWFRGRTNKPQDVS